MSRSHNIQMLEVVTQALGPDLCQQVAFIGGCTTALLLTDEFSLEEVRYTDDVDLVIHLTGYAQWQKLVEQLREKGFKQSPQDDVVCRMRLGELKVDFMPEDAETADLLGCNNRWFKDGLACAQWHEAVAAFACSPHPTFSAANSRPMPGVARTTHWGVRILKTSSTWSMAAKNYSRKLKAPHPSYAPIWQKNLRSC